MLRPDSLVASQDRQSVDEPRGSEVNVHSFLPQLFRSGGFVDLLNGSVEILLNPGHVRYRRLRHDSVLRSCAYMVRNFGRFQKGFAGNAAGPGAISPDAIFLDKRHLCSELHRKSRRNQAAGTSPDDHQVILLFRHRSVP